MLDGNSRAIQASLCETETVNQMLTLKKWEEESTVGVWSRRISRQKPVLLFQLTYLSFFFFFALYNIVLVWPYINMHLPWVYLCSPFWTLLPPPSPYHPSGSSQCTSPKLPVSSIEPGLVIHFLYDIIHVLMPFSQIIPLLLLHRVQKTVLYICVSFAALHTGLSLPSF